MNSSVNCSIAFHNVNKTRATTRLEQELLVVTSKVVTYRIVLLQKDYTMHWWSLWCDDAVTGFCVTHRVGVTGDDA